MQLWFLLHTGVLLAVSDDENRIAGLDGFQKCGARLDGIEQSSIGFAVLFQGDCGKFGNFLQEFRPGAVKAGDDLGIIVESEKCN